MKKYEKPEVEIILIEAEDIICNSNEGSNESIGN